MIMNEHSLQMLRALTDAPGTSGFEGEVVKVARRYAHATNCISTEFDFKTTVQMVMALLKNIDVIFKIQRYVFYAPLW